MTQGTQDSPDSSTRGCLSTHFLSLLSWVAGDSFGSSGAWGSLSNKTGPELCAEAGWGGQGLGRAEGSRREPQFGLGLWVLYHTPSPWYTAVTLYSSGFRVMVLESDSPCPDLEVAMCWQQP